MTISGPGYSNKMTQLDSNRPYAEFLEILRRPTELLNEPPLPGGHQEELFSVERLEQYAAKLAVALTVSPKPRRGRSLLRELK